MQWCCSEENHKHGGIHYHAAIKLKKICRWSGCKRVLKQRYGITVNFSSHHHNYYSAWCYLTKSDTDFQESEGHPDLKSKGKPKTSKASDKVAKKGRKRGPDGSKVAKSKKRKRLTSSEVADILLAKNIKTVTELQALAYTQKREGKEDLMDFIIGRSRKAVSELLETTWEIKEAGEKIARAHKSRVEILREAGNEECLCATREEWLECARQVLQNNDIEERTFGRAIMTALEKGRGKYRNIMIIGPANCAKTFLLKPLSVIYNTVCNPATGSFAWVGVQDKECIFLNDFRWSQQLLPWHDLLLLLEGEIVHFPAPKTHFMQDIQLTKDTPIFCTTKRPLLFIKNGMVDDRESEMMAVRWKIFELRVQIPETSQRAIPPCPSCFAKLITCGL